MNKKNVIAISAIAVIAVLTISLYPVLAGNFGKCNREFLDNGLGGINYFYSECHLPNGKLVQCVEAQLNSGSNVAIGISCETKK